MARATVKDLRAEFPGANHHVYAFRVGFGNTVTEGMSDDGEPSGTAGPPTLAVVRGSDVGDIVLVTARFFGGIKLGTGGLVRAYTESAQEALRMLRTELKVERLVVGLEMPYSLYNIVKLLIAEHKGVVEDAVFDEQILVIAKFVVSDLRRFEPVLARANCGTCDACHVVLGALRHLLRHQPADLPDRPMGWRDGFGPANEFARIIKLIIHEQIIGHLHQQINVTGICQ